MLFASVDRLNRINHSFEIRSLLQPKHLFFQDKYATIEDYAAYYRDDGCRNLMLYARCKGGGRMNPYRRYKCKRDSASSTVREIFQIKEAAGLDNLKAIRLTLTFPAELSQALSSKPRGLDIAWRVFQRWWANCLLSLDSDSPGLSCMVNLHFWSTQQPLKPHFHFHVLLFNYRLAEVFNDPEEGLTYELRQRPFPLNESNKQVPFTKAQLSQLRACWKNCLILMAFRHVIPCSTLENGSDVDIEVNYFNLDKDRGRASFANLVKYQTRPPIVDYARYSSKNLNCPDPTELIQTYTNKSRVYGWLNNRKNIIGTLPETEKTKLSPFDSKPMIFVGKITTEGLIARSRGELGFLDFRQGKPILRDSTQADIDWLRSVDYWAYPNPGWFKRHPKEYPANCTDSPPP